MNSLHEFHTKPCVGLTGGIGSGKSTVAGLFEALGAGIIDTDAIAHQLTQPGAQAIAFILATFGEDYLTPTGAMDRSKIRRLILAEPTARNKLENILHPLILAACEQRLASPRDAPYTLLVAPLLFENPPFLQLVQRTLVVDCSVPNQISRVMQRGGLIEPEIRGIIALQMPRTERLALADDIIQNDGMYDNLTGQVAILHRQYSNINNNHLTGS